MINDTIRAVKNFKYERDNMNLPISSDLKITISDNLDVENVIFTIPADYYGMRLDAVLAEIITDLSRNKLTNWLKDGYILIDKKITKPKEKIKGGEEVVITIPFDEEAQAYTPENIPLNIIYADEEVIVINKPAGLTVHPGAGNWNGTLLNAILYHFPETAHIPRAGIVHRLDKDTSGLMVVARTLGAQLSLVEQLQSRTVSRIYRAFVEGNTYKEGIVNKNIGRDPHNRIKMTSLQHGGKPAVTHYRLLKQFDKIAYIECKLETGRTHQIRVHMRDIAHPLIGDPVYGTKKNNYVPEVVDAIENLNRQALHAIKLSFVHPKTGEVLNFKSKMADDMKNLLAALSYSQNNQLDDEDWDDDDDDGWEIIYAYDKE